MITLNFNGPVHDHRGNEIADFHLAVADCLVATNQGDYAKHVAWATQIVHTGVIQVDETDLEKLKKFFENNERLAHIAKYRIMEILKSAKGES